MDKREQLKEFLLENSNAVSGNIKISSTEGCFQQTVNPGRGKGVLMLDVGQCKIKSYQAVDLNVNRLDEIFIKLENIFNPKKK